MNVEWEHKDIWRTRCRSFAVEVSRHTVDGENRWAIYAYIYPDHPRFGRFNGNNMWQPASSDLQVHSFPSLLKRHVDEKQVITSFQVGWDYSHIRDEHYAHLATRAEAESIFRDAERLIEQLNKE